jgi:regulator of protease activity HflC (stomatin/prohibitin superfamily)
MGAVALGIFLVVASFLIAGALKQADTKVDARPAAFIMRGIGIILLVGGVLWSGVTQVPAGSQGVLLRFGALQGSLNPGIHLIVPGVNEVILMETRTQKEESQATAASRDLQVVTTTIALNYRLDAVKVPQIFAGVGPGYRERIIAPAIQESLKVVTSRYTAEELIRNRQQVKNEVEADVTKRLLAYNILVDPQGVSIVNFEFSPEFNRAIEAKQVAQQEAEKQKFVLQQAELQRQTEVARAKGSAEAARLNAESLRAQGGSLVIAREWITKWDGKLPSVSGGGNQFILDLQSLLKENPPPR